VEAINCVNYIVNHTPTKDLKNITLEEAWTKTKSNVSHFHVFGSVAWDHIPNEKMKELQPKSEKFIFVGYSEVVEGYKILQLHSNEISFRRHVKFDENIFACEPNLVFVSSLACKPYLAFAPSLMFVPYFCRFMVYFSDDDSEDENPPSISHFLQMSPLNMNMH
jgi:hypothetical protein